MADEIKPKSKGGKRPGAGRKPSTFKGLLKTLPPDTSALILMEINANKQWIELANSKDENIRFKVLSYLTDRAHGKAQQSVNMNATVKSFDNWTDQQLAEFIAGHTVIPSGGSA